MVSSLVYGSQDGEHWGQRLAMPIVIKVIHNMEGRYSAVFALESSRSKITAMLLNHHLWEKPHLDNWFLLMPRTSARINIIFFIVLYYSGKEELY